MEKLNLTPEQKHLMAQTDSIIKSGDVNLMLKHFAMLMTDGLTPTPRQIAKVSAHIYKTGDENLNLDFAVEFGGMGAFVDKLGEIVIERGNSEDNFDFAQYVEGADIIAHGRAIKKKRNKLWWNAFMRRFPEQARVIMQGTTRERDQEQAHEHSAVHQR